MAKKRAKSEEPKKTVKSEEPKKKKPISLNILEIAKRIQKLEQTSGMPSEYPASKVMLNSGDSVEEKIGNVRIAKLWENPSPTADFAAQGLPLDLSGYDFVLTIATNGISALNGTAVNDSVNICEPVASANGLFNRRRLGYITATGITFNDCYKGTSLSAGSVDNGNCVPLIIYGIKLT